MHILFLTHYFPPEVNAPASRTYQHAKRWVRQADVQVTVVTNHPNHPKGILYPGHANDWIRYEEIDGIQVCRVKTFLAVNAAMVRRTFSYLFFMVAAVVGATRVRDVDVVVATSPQFFCAIAGWLVSRMKRKPFVFELRDLWPDSIVTVGAMKARWAIRMVEKLELFLYREASLIVAVTESFRENLVARGIPAAKIAVVKNGADLEFFQPRLRPSELAERVGAEGKFVAAYIGTVGMAHAVYSIVEAAESLRDEPGILLLVIGEGAEKQNVERLAASKELQNIRVLPGVGKEAIREYYALTDLNLVTLRDQSLFRTVIPSKIFEIMSMGRPILSTVQGESRSILESARAAAFAPPEDPRALAAAIVALSKDRDRLRQMGADGRQFVQENYNRDRLASDLLLLLRQVASQHSAGGGATSAPVGPGGGYWKISKF